MLFSGVCCVCYGISVLVGEMKSVLWGDNNIIRSFQLLLRNYIQFSLLGKQLPEGNQLVEKKRPVLNDTSTKRVDNNTILKS